MNFETEMRNRIIRLEEKVDFLLKELKLNEKEASANSGPVDPILAETIRLIREGNTAGAVNFYAKNKGVGTKVALAVVHQHM